MEQIIARAKIRFCLTLPRSCKTQLNMECQFFLVVSLYSAITSQRNLKVILILLFLSHNFRSNSKHIQTHALIFNTKLEGMTKSRFQKICLIASLLLCVMHPESHIKAVKAESPLDYTCTMTNSPHPLCEERIKGTCMSFKWLHMAMLSWIPKRIIVCRGGQHTETTSTKERRYLSEHQVKKESHKSKH